MKHQYFFTYFLFWLASMGFFIAPSYAQVTYDSQKKPTQSEQQLDALIRECALAQETFGDKFEFSEWTAQLQFYTRKVIQRLSAEFLSEIASQKKKVMALQALAETCPELSKVKTELADIKKIYENKIVYSKETVSGDLFEDEQVEAKMDKGDAEDLLKKIEKLQKKLAITRYIIRIQ